MRKKIYPKTRDNQVVILFTLLILLFLNIFNSNLVTAQEKELILSVINESYEQIDKIEEGEYFIVGTYILNESGLPVYQEGVEIEFDGKIYQITIEDENFEITIKAPQVSEDTMFTVKASKTGFGSDNVTITVLNKSQLIITPDTYTVESNKQFSIVVTDENGKSVSGATVGIQSCTGEDCVKITNDNGRVWLITPEGHNEIILIAQKEGYIDGKPIILGVNTNPGVIELIVNNPYSPIFIAVVLLILAILFVNFRQKMNVEKIQDGFLKEQPSKKYTTNRKNGLTPAHKVIRKPVNHYKSKEDVRIEPKREPKIEEIRINRSSKDKKIVSMNHESEEERKTNYHKTARKHDYDWFEGTHNIRYEIDKITGKIDEEGIDKWFEGMDEIRAKIDEKVKKKDEEKR
jgi:hypothetical protein